MSEIDSLYAIRVVTKDAVEFVRTTEYYGALLGQSPFRQFGDAESVHQAAFFRLGEIELVVTREAEPTPEARIDQGPVWLCFKTDDPDATFEVANQRGAVLETPPVTTSFGTRAFFSNDPAGLAVYVGTGWD